MLETNSETAARPKEQVLDLFKNLPIGSTMCVEIIYIKPSQTDDGTRNESREPISVYFERGKLIINQGNHRYYTQQHLGESTIIVKKVNNPNENW